jgi:TP901 family phage tail tape measure protein
MSSDQKITSFIDVKAVEDIRLLVKELQNAQAAFRPLMTEIRETSKTMGTSSKDVRAMIEAFSAYNKIMEEGSDKVKRYNDLQSQITATQRKIKDADKERLDTLTRLKEEMAKLEAESKKRVTAEAAESNEVKKATRAKVEARTETQRMTAEMKRQMDVEKGKSASTRQMTADIQRLLVTAKDENLTLRAKTALLAQLREKYKDVGSQLQSQLIPTIQKLDREVKKADAAVGVHSRNVGNYGQSMRGLAALIPGLSRFFTGFGAIGIAVMGLVTVFSKLSEAVQYGFKTIKEFEQANANLASILQTTTVNTRALQIQQLQLGLTTEYTASQVTLAHTELAKLGFAQQTIINMTKPLLGFATALGASLPQAALVAGRTLRAFNESSFETEKVLTLMTTTVNKSAMDFPFLERSIAIVGASASVANVPLKDTLALLGVLANSGLDASRAATALRNVFLYLSDTSKKLGKELKGTKMDATSISKAFVDLRKKGVDLADMFQLTDKRAVNALAVLIQNAEQITVLRDEITDLTGTLDKLRNTRLDTVEGDIILMKSAWDAFWLSFRDNTPIIRDTIQWITGNLKLIANERQKELVRDEGSSVYATNLVDEARVRALTGAASDELAALAKKYNEALGGTQQETDVAYQNLLAAQKKWKDKANIIYKEAEKGTSGFSSVIKREMNSVQTKWEQWQKDILIRSYDNIDILTKNIATTETNIKGIQKKITENITSEERYQLEKQVGELNAKIAEYGKKIISYKRTIGETFNKLEGEGTGIFDGVTSLSFGAQVKKARESIQAMEGYRLTAERISSGILGMVAESARVNVEETIGGSYEPETKKTKAQIEEERRLQKLQEMRNAEELAAYQIKINRLKGIAAEQKAIAEEDTEYWVARKEAIDDYVYTLSLLASTDYLKAESKLKQDALKSNVGLTGKVTDKNIIDPITGLPQTDVEKATLQQRLSLHQEYLTEIIKLEVEADGIREKIEKQQVTNSEANIKTQLENFKDGLEQRLKDVESARLKEQNALSKLFNSGEINETLYRDETLKTNIIFDKKALAQVRLYYGQFIEQLDLPEVLKEKLKEVFNAQYQALADEVVKSETSFEVQTGRTPAQSNKRTIGSKLRSLFGGGVKRNAEGNVDVEGSGNTAAKFGKKMSNVLNSEEVSMATSLFSGLADVMSSYYDAEIAKIDEVMAKNRERYEEQQKQLDDSLTYLQDNYDAGLLSEENYAARQKQIQMEKLTLERKNAAEEKKMEEQKRKFSIEQAKWNKHNAYVQTVMSTAQGIATALTLLPPLNFIMAAAVGALGAAQIGMIAAQQIPQYAQGTSDHKGGLMMVGDGGVSEYVLDPKGNVTKTSNVPSYMVAPAHTKVFKNDDEFLSYLYDINGNVDKNGGQAIINNISVDTDYVEQRKLLRSIDAQIGRLNANENYRINLERHKQYSQQW